MNRSDGNWISTPTRPRRCTKLREGIVERKPVEVLSGEVECDEVYVVAGHKGNPEAVKKRGRSPDGVA